MSDEIFKSLDDKEEYDDSTFEKFPFPEEKTFIDAVANDCVANMSDETKSFLLDPANKCMHHFGYGLYIRNTYIYVRKEGIPELPYPVIADDMSGAILERIIELLREG